MMRQELEAAYQQLALGMTMNDPCLVLKFHQEFTTADFSEQQLGWKSAAGRIVHREHVLKPFRDAIGKEPLCRNFKTVTVEIIIDELTTTDDTARAVTLYKREAIETDIYGLDGPKDANHERIDISRWQETWIKTANGWKLQFREMLEWHIWRDKKHVYPQAG